MATEQTNITEAIAHAVAEAAKAAIQSMTVANICNSQRIQNVVSKIVRAILKQPRFKWEADFI